MIKDIYIKVLPLVTPFFLAYKAVKKTLIFVNSLKRSATINNSKSFKFVTIQIKHYA